MSILSTFSKGCKGSIALNACKGSGIFCSLACPFNLSNPNRKENDVACYTETSQNTYKRLIPFLAKHSDDFTGFLYGILSHIKDLQLAPWVRFSSFGSFPEQAQLDYEQKELLLKVASRLKKQTKAGKVHFPVETFSKYVYYKSLGFLPRLSNAKSSHFVRLTSLVCGSLKDPMLKRISDSKKLARELMNDGCKTVVCPAVAPRNAKKKIKCGQCTACGSKKVHTIIYPVHV